MRRCEDPTCWPIAHAYVDHTDPSPEIVAWLIETGRWIVAPGRSA